MFILNGHKQPVQRVEFSADGRTLLSVDSQYDVNLWDLETRVARWMIRRKCFSSVTFTPDCRQVLTGAHRLTRSQGYRVGSSAFEEANPIALRDVETGTPTPAPIQHGPESCPYDLIFTPDGTRCVAHDLYNFRQLLWWEYPSGGPLPTWDSRFGALAFSPDGRMLSNTTESGVDLYDVASGELCFVYPIPIRPYSCHPVFPPNSKYLAVGSGPKMVILDLDTRKEITELRLPKKHFLGAAFTRDGRYLATVSHEATVKFWDTSSWRVTQEYAWEVGGLRCIAFDRDGFRAAAAGTGKKIVVWDLDD